MKKTYLLALLICCVVLFTGCPYKAAVSIDSPTAYKVEHKLTGKWQNRNSEDDTYVVKESDDHTYDITVKHKKEKGQDKQDDEHYGAFISEVDGTKFLNVYSTTDDPRTYYFYKLEFNDGGGFFLYPVSDYITETFATSEELKKYVKQYMSLSFFFGPKDEYIKS